MDMIDPENSERKYPEGPVALRALVVARGQAAKLLAAGEQVLHFVPLPVQRPVERPGPVLVRLARDAGPDPAPPAALADRPTAVALVSSDPAGAQARSAGTLALDRPLGQQLGKHRGLMRLARGEHQGHRLSAALRPDVGFCAEAALAAPERFGFWVPPFAPALCWCARITVPSTKWRDQSIWPAASACCWT